MSYGTLCEAILDGATLHSSQDRPRVERPLSGVTFKERDLSLVRKSG